LTSLSLIIGVAVFETIFSYCLPPGITSLTTAKLSPQVLSGAFRMVYFLGGLVYLLSMVVSALAVTKFGQKKPASCSEKEIIG